MAITAVPYTYFLLNLAKAHHDFTTAAYKVALLTSAYTPAMDTHVVFGDVSAAQVVDASYTAQSLANKTVVTSSGTLPVKLNADPVVWSSLTATFRYAVVYKDASPADLVGLFDFGADRVYSADSFQLSFPSGVALITTS